MIVRAASVLPAGAWLSLGVVLVAGAAWGAAILVKRWRRTRFAEYGSSVVTFDLEKDGPIRYARWLHPKEEPKTVRQRDVDGLRRFVREGDTVIDIGAHTGDTTMPLALAAGVQGCTFALEPNPFVFKILAENAALNRDKTNIVPLEFAATETDGVFTFDYSDGAYCNGGFLSRIANQRHGHPCALEVQGRNLEGFLRREHGDRLERLSYIKIDAEGYDVHVIASMMGLVRECRPVIVCEVYSRLTREEREKLFDVLREAGYRSHKYEGGDKPQGRRVEREDLMRWHTFDILALPG